MENGWWTPINHWILGYLQTNPSVEGVHGIHPDFFFRPKKHTPVLWRNHVGNEKNPSCPSSSLTVPYVLWGFMMIYMDTIMVPFCCRTAKELTLKKSTNHPIPAMTHLPKYCPTKKKHWEFIISVPSSSSFIFHGTFFFCPQEKLHMPNHGFLLGIPFHHAKMSPKKTCPPPIHQKIYPVHVWISLQGSKNVLKVSIIFNDLHKYLINMGLSENRVYSQLYPFNRDNDH